MPYLKYIQYSNQLVFSEGEGKWLYHVVLFLEGGQIDCNLYLTPKHVFKNFAEKLPSVTPPWLRACMQASEYRLKSMLLILCSFINLQKLKLLSEYQFYKLGCTQQKWNFYQFLFTRNIMTLETKLMRGMSLVMKAL